MKYLAILKDSLREALDTKVLYATATISILLVLLVQTTTYRPVPPQEQLQRFTQMFNLVVDIGTQGQGPRYEIRNFHQTNDAAEPWNGNYGFLFIVMLGNEENADKIRTSNMFSTPQIQQQLQQTFSWIDELKVSNVPSPAPAEVAFQVDTRGTKISDRLEWVHEPGLFFGYVPVPLAQGSLAGIIEFIADDVIGTFGAAVTMLLSIVVTAFFVPNMLRKGSIDLLLAKPIHRSSLLIYKFIGGLTFMFLNTLLILGGIWLALGVQAGIWVNALLLCVLIFTFQFAIFYAVSTWFAVLTRSPIVCILAGVLAWAIFWVVGMSYRGLESVRKQAGGNSVASEKLLPRWVFVTGDVLHFITPHYKDLDTLATKLIRDDVLPATNPSRIAINEEVGAKSWVESISVTSAFIAILVGLSCWRFARRDY